MTDQHAESPPVPIPANLELEDKIIAELTGRQVIILCAGLTVLYAGYQTTHTVLPPVVLVGLAMPIVVATLALALVRRDGMALDRYLWGAVRHLATTRRLPAGEHPTTTGGQVDPGRGAGWARGGWWALPRQPITPPQIAAWEVAQAGGFGVVDLGEHGLAALAVIGPVSWTLRSSPEQDALVATFARWLHSLAAPVQILVRAAPLDLSGHFTQLDTATHHADQTGRPALADAAADHAAHLAALAAEHELMCRQIILVFREPIPTTPGASEDSQARRDRAALGRLARRLADATALLAPAGVTLTPLDATAAETILAQACRTHTPGPERPAHRHTSQPDPDPAIGDPADEDAGWYPLLPLRGEQR